MDLTLHLERTARSPDARRSASSRSTRCARCSASSLTTVTRAGDAFITAQVFLRLLKIAVRHGRKTLGRIIQPYIVAQT